MSDPKDLYFPPNEDLSKRSILLVDHGVFFHVALRLAHDFGTVYYVDTTWESAWSKLDHAIVGDGFGDIVRVGEAWGPIRKGLVDMVMFTDIHHSEMQLYLEDQGMPVWGARDCDRMEWHKLYFRRLQKELGMDIPEFEEIVGTEALREHCRTHDGWFYKASPQYRGLVETFGNKDYLTSRQTIDGMAYTLGCVQDVVKFIGEAPIESELEGGIDTYCIDGQLPFYAVNGWEKKDEGYFAAVQEYRQIDQRLRNGHEPLLPTLKQKRYRQMLSTEVKITKGGSILLEPTTRFPSPAGEEQCLLYANFGQIVWWGARGELRHQEPTAKFACEAMVEHNEDEETFRAVNIHPEVRDFVKLYNLTQVGDRYATCPGGKVIGAICGIGDTPTEAVQMLKWVEEHMKDEPVTIHRASLCHLVQEIEEAQRKGVYFTDLPMPTMDDIMKKSKPKPVMDEEAVPA